MLISLLYCNFDSFRRVLFISEATVKLGITQAFIYGAHISQVMYRLVNVCHFGDHSCDNSQLLSCIDELVCGVLVAVMYVLVQICSMSRVFLSSNYQILFRAYI